MAKAIFARPERAPVRGGAYVSAYLVPVFEGRLVAFDVTAPEARGRWLPWTVLDFGQNPYEAASGLVDQWCQGAVTDLTLVDVLSLPAEGGGWELAIVFRAELAAPPKGADDRHPFLFERGRFDAIAAFDPVDLERWVAAGPPPPGATAPPAPSRPSGNAMIF